jgi:hypothetical protein
MRDDDEILESYERELTAAPAPARANRGFWLVAGTMLIACIVLLAEIFANRGIKDTIAHAQSSLRTAQAAAERVHGDSGSFREASADDLARSEPSLSFGGADDPSGGLDDVSVDASDVAWAAAVQARPGACFYLRLDTGGDVLYGTGTICTGAEAMDRATDSRW